MCAMDPRRIASVTAVLGGLAWLLRVGLVVTDSGHSTDSELVGYATLVGWVALAIALAAAGYTLVEVAPVWLRAVVAAATMLLVLMMWWLADEGAKSMLPGDSWLRDEVSMVISAVIALVMGFWGFTRHRPPSHEKPAPPARGRRAAR